MDTESRSRPGERRRGRPRAFCEEAALEAAQRAFAAQGYDGVTVAALTEAIGIRPPSFYAAFGSKAALFERVVDRYAAGEGGFVDEALVGEDAGAALRALLSRAAALYAEGGAGCLVTEAARDAAEPAAVAACRAVGARTRARIAAYLEGRGVAEAERVAGLTMIAMTGLSGAARQGTPPAEMSAFAELAADALAARL